MMNGTRIIVLIRLASLQEILSGKSISRDLFLIFYRGGFDANLEVTLKQMESYQKLLKTATASVSKFVQQVDDAAAFGYLAENNSDEFSFDFSDT